MNSVTLCEACGHELLLQPDWFGRPLYCPGCRARLRPPAPPAARSAPRGRRLGLVLLLVGLASVPAAFGASKMLWPAAPVSSYPEANPVPPDERAADVAAAHHWLRALRADLSWARAYAAPWVGRKLRGRSTGDLVDPKRPELSVLRAADVLPEPGL